MRIIKITLAFFCISICIFPIYASKRHTTIANSIVILSNDVAQLSIDLKGGAIVDFHLKESKINPFTWKVSKEQMPANNKSGAVFQGHFLCTGRWGAPTEGEMKAGVPHNGQAARDKWKVLRSSKTSLTMQIKAALDGVIITRIIELLPNSASFKVTETFHNFTTVGRLFNVVQHATIGTPYLNEDCIVETNANQGFLQTYAYPNPHKLAYSWPMAKSTTGSDSIDLRRTDTPESYVSTHVFSDSIAWITINNPVYGLKLKYSWKTAEYPWINIWQQRVDGKLWAKGLEFGTAGIGKSYQELLANDTRFHGRSSFFFLDAGEVVCKTYYCTLINNLAVNQLIN